MKSETSTVLSYRRLPYIPLHAMYIPGGDNESAALLPQRVLWELNLLYLQSKQREKGGDILIKNFAWLIIMWFLH